jgi:hypothetical protein
MELITNIENDLVEFSKDLPYVNELTVQQKEVMNNGLKTIFKKAQTKKTYKELLNYFNDLEEPENDDLAKELFNNDDFIKYKLQEDERIKRLKEMSGIIVKDTSYISIIGIVSGAVKEIFWSSYSHAPLLDVINSIRTKINEYTRMIRTKYNAYTDLITDVTVELSSLTQKTETAINRFFNIIATGAVIGGQIVGIISYIKFNKFLNKKRGSYLIGEESRLLKNE